MTAEHFMRVLAFEGFGWKDIHATNQVVADPNFILSNKSLLIKAAADRLPGSIRNVVRKVLESYSSK